MLNHLLHLALAATLLLSGPSAAAIGPDPPPDFPRREYETAAREGARVYRVEPAGSQLVIQVYPEGWLAPVLGHRHIVSTRQLHGLVLLPARGPARANVYLSVQDLEVNDPTLRAEAGLEPVMNEEGNARTRRNMLDDVLEADRFPYIRLRIEERDAERLPVALTLHGRTRQLAVPATLRLGPQMLSASGSFRVQQTDFGIEPFSVLAGALRVADRLDVTFEIRAVRLPDDPAGWE